MADFRSANDLVVVRRFRDLPQAEVAKTVLESAGIACSLRDDVVVGTNWSWSNALGGIKVCVRGQDVEAAAQLLDQRAPESYEVEGVGEFQQPRCPKCDSIKVSLEGANAARARLLSGMWLGIPIPLPTGRHWKCDSCGHEWPDSEKPELTPPGGNKPS